MDVVFGSDSIKLVELLGEGGTGEIFRGILGSSGQDVAVKVLRASLRALESPHKAGQRKQHYKISQKKRPRRTGRSQPTDQRLSRRRARRRDPLKTPMSKSPESRPGVGTRALKILQPTLMLFHCPLNRSSKPIYRIWRILRLSRRASKLH